MDSFTVHRIERSSDNGQTEHGGALIAIDKHFRHKRLSLDPKFSDTIVNPVDFNIYSCILCCIYTAPKRGHYRHQLLLLSDLLTTLEVIGPQSAASLNLLVGDIILGCTDWQQMVSSHYDDGVFLGDLVNLNFHQMIKRDIVLTNNTDPILNVCVDNKIKQMHNSDHDPFQMKTNASDWFKVGRPKLEKRDFNIFLYSKADWKHNEAQIEDHLFLQYYYKNVNLMLDY